MPAWEQVSLGEVWPGVTVALQAHSGEKVFLTLRPAPVELEPGQTRKETEGVFVIRDNRAVFVPIKIGIAGDRYFEVLSGIKPGEQVITGPYSSVRGMADGDQVRVQTTPSPARGAGAGS